MTTPLPAECRRVIPIPDLPALAAERGGSTPGRVKTPTASPIEQHKVLCSSMRESFWSPIWGYSHNIIAQNGIRSGFSHGLVNRASSIARVLMAAYGADLPLLER